MPDQTLPIDLVEPCEPAPRGDRFPAHLFMAALEWPVPPEAVLRADKPAPPLTCPPCNRACHQGRDCPTFAPLHAVRIESLREANARHRRFGRRLVLALALGWLGMGLLLLALP